MSYQVYPSVAGTFPTLNPQGILRELYIPLWMAETTYATVTSGSAGYIQKFSTSSTTTGTGPRVSLHTLSTKWSTTQKFAFEACIQTANATVSSTVTLYDITAGSAVATLTASTTSLTLVRSGTFNLIPGHVYGVSATNNTYATYISKAHIVALM